MGRRRPHVEHSTVEGYSGAIQHPFDLLGTGRLDGGKAKANKARHYLMRL
jgi:hypothetical protein